MLIKVEGIVIRTVPYGEANVVLTLLTQDRGKLAVMANGAKRGKSKLRAASQLFSQGIFLLFAGKGMPSLNQAEVLHFFHLQENIRQTAYASYLCELVTRLIPDHEPNPALYDLLLTMLQYLEEGKDPDIIGRIFEMKVLNSIGLQPELTSCIHCRSTAPPFLFSIKEGGLLCQQCIAHDPYAIGISEATQKLLRLFQVMDSHRVGAIAVKQETQKQMAQIMSRFIEEHTAVQCKSRAFIEQLDRNGL